MGLIVVGPSGRSGRIIVEDDRDDGSVVLLVCETYGPQQSGAILVPPEKEEATSRGSFPYFFRVQSMLGPTEESPFEIRVDTSDMPTGPLAFVADRFIAQSLEAARTGAERVAMSLETADSWGHVSLEG